MPALEVLAPGPLATVQDLGRAGLGRFGVSPSGAMDPLALRLANRLVGNEEGAAALEITGPGAAVVFRGPVTLALCGADLGATLAESPVERYRAYSARDGEVLRLPVRRSGARAVLGIAGGIEAPLVLGSAATDLDAGLGGARLSKGDRLAIGSQSAHGRTPPDRGLLQSLLSAYYPLSCLRYVPADDAGISEAAQSVFAHATFRVTDRSNRTGYRLSGPAVPVTPQPERLSEPVAPGALQVPPDGQPILLMADRQTVGGYASIGHLIAADRPKAAQLWPGDEVRFAPVTLEEARAAARALERALQMADGMTARR